MFADGVGLLAAAAAEKIREQRRLARKQFKIDRAQAVLDAAMTAEAVLTTGQSPYSPSGPEQPGSAVEDDEETSASLAPSTAASKNSVVDVSALNAQTFLVRPTRPDANRNRGRKAFRRGPPASTSPTAPVTTDSTAQSSVDAQVPPAIPRETGVTDAARTPSTRNNLQAALEEEDDDGEDEGQELDETVVEDMEHLQLGLEEAWFLSAALGVLRVYDPSTVRLRRHRETLLLS